MAKLKRRTGRTATVLVSDSPVWHAQLIYVCYFIFLSVHVSEITDGHAIW